MTKVSTPGLSECPPDPLVLLYLHSPKSIGPKETKWIEEHLAACQRCAGLMDLAGEEITQESVQASLLASPANLVASPKQHSPKGQPSLVFWGVAALLAVVVVTYIIVDPRIAWLRDENRDLRLKAEKSGGEITQLHEKLESLGKKLPSYELSDPRIFIIRGTDKIELELQINPHDVKEVRVQYDAPGLVRNPKVNDVRYSQKERPATPTANMVAVNWSKDDLFSRGDMIDFSPILEIVPFPEARDKFPNLDEDKVVRFRGQLFVTPKGVREKLGTLRSLIEELGLNQPVRSSDPDVFRLVGKDRIAFDLDVNLAYVKEVIVKWGNEKPGAEGTRLESGARQPLTDWSLKHLSATSPPLKSDGGFGAVTATLTVVYFPEARKLAHDFLPKEPHEFKREFLLTPYGITTDPDRLPKTSLDRLEYAPDKDRKLDNLYIAMGKALRMQGAPPEGFLMIAPVLASGVRLGSSFAISPDGFFATRCYLGTRLDNEKFGLFLLVPTRAGATPIRDGEIYPENYDWEKHGYSKSPTRLVRNDGSGKFEK